MRAIDHRAAYFQAHFALQGLPEYRAPYEALNDGELRAQRDVLRHGRADAAGLRGLRARPGARGRRRSTCRSRPSTTPSLAPAGKHAASSFAFYLPIGDDRETQNRLRDEMAERIVAKIASVAPNFPDLVERQLNYPAYTYELMFGCTGGDFTHGLLQPEFMGPFRPGPRGWPDNPVPVEGLYLCGAGCHGGPGVTFIPGYNCGYAVLEGTSERL